MIPEGAAEIPKRPKLTLPAKRPGTSRAAPAGSVVETVILLGAEPSAPPPSVPRDVETPPSVSPPADAGSPTLIGAADHAAQRAVAPGDIRLVREKLRSSSNPPELRRKGFFTDLPDKGLFLGFAVLGFVGIFAAKEMAYSGLPVAFAAVGLLVAYAFLAARLDAFKSNPDRLGDNCYYMGFLFTLASLSAALVALQRDTASGRGDLLEALIGGFGVALFSTIGGITLRVFFMQMRREIEDLEQHIRTDLERSAGLLKHHLSEAVMDLENLRQHTQQVMKQQMEGATSGFSGMADKLFEHVAAAGAAYGEASERMAANADRVAADIGRLADRVERIEVPSDLLTRQVDDARGRIEALALALEASFEAGGTRQLALEQSSQTLDALLTRMCDVTLFSTIERSAESLAIAVEATTTKVADVSMGLAAYASSIGVAAAQVERDGQTVSRARDRIDDDLRQSTEALHKLQGTLADVADGLVAWATAPPAVGFP